VNYDRDSSSASSSEYHVSMDAAGTSSVRPSEAPAADVIKSVDDDKLQSAAPRKLGKTHGGLSSGSDVRFQLSDLGSVPSFQYYEVSCLHTSSFEPSNSKKPKS